MNKKLQVFVSSTYTDLIEERQAAVESILDAGHIPAGMELFKAGNESQLQTIYKWIDESDVYMLILGGRYGSIELKSGRSYTQLEYEYALSKNIPVFAVVLSKSFLTQKINSLGLSNVTETSFPDKYKEFKTFVMSKIIREVDDCKDIKISIHSTLNEFINTYEFNGWIRNESFYYKSPFLSNKETKQPINEHQNKNTELINNIDRFYLLKLIDIFQCKTFEVFYSDATEKSYEINAIDEFIECYEDFCMGVNIPSFIINILKLDPYPLLSEICPYFENFQLLKREEKTYTITELGKSFYTLLESRK